MSFLEDKENDVSYKHYPHSWPVLLNQIQQSSIYRV